MVTGRRAGLLPLVSSGCFCISRAAANSGAAASVGPRGRQRLSFCRLRGQRRRESLAKLSVYRGKGLKFARMRAFVFHNCDVAIAEAKRGKLITRTYVQRASALVSRRCAPGAHAASFRAPKRAAAVYRRREIFGCVAKAKKGELDSCRLQSLVSARWAETW